MANAAQRRDGARDEDSVVTGLRELRRIEEDRTRDERRAEEARLQAIADEERRRRDDEAARVRADEDAERRRRDDEARAAREADLRLREVGLRAQAQASIEIEGARLTMEAALRQHEIARRRPIWLLVTTVAFLGAVALLAWTSAARDRDAADAKHRADTLRRRITVLEERLRASEEQRAQVEQALVVARARPTTTPRTPPPDDRGPRRPPAPAPRPGSRPPVTLPPPIDLGDCADKPLACLKR